LRTRVGVLALGLGALAVLASGCDVEFLRTQRENELKQKPAIQLPPSVLAPSPAPPSQVVPPAGAPRSFADLAAQADPAVVFVRRGQLMRRGRRNVMAEAGHGSGFIFDASGLILTNYHVVEDTDAIQVELSDGRTFPAEVVGKDGLTEIAVLRISVPNLPVLTLGDSDGTRIGDWVLAIGNPFGLSHTVSAGIISARDRTGQEVQISDPTAYFSFLQTDASINPGNSGGPLIDLQGRVVGINTAIRANANSIGFAIPINMVREILPRLVKEGFVHRSAIGVQVAHGLNDGGLRERGALIAAVVKDGPAERAGFQPGDVVVEFDGKVIDTPERLRWRVSLSTAGHDVPVVVTRNAQRLTLNVAPWPMPDR